MVLGAPFPQHSVGRRAKDVEDGNLSDGRAHGAGLRAQYSSWTL